MATKNKIEHRKIEEFTTDPRNANLGSERGLRVLDDSIAETGLGRSIVVDKNGVVIGGNKTTERSIDRGFNDAVVVHTDGKQLVIVQRDDLDLSDTDPNNPARKLAYYDNVASQHLAWDANQIAADVEAGVDLSHMFTNGELDYILNPILVYGDDERGYTPDEALDVFMNATIKQIVLLFDNEQYKQVVEMLAVIRGIENVETNTEAFLRMLALYEKHISLKTGT